MPSPKQRNWMYRLFNDLYEVTVWLKEDDKTSTKIVYHMKHLNKISNTYMRGIDTDGHKIELKTVEPFDYHVKKLY
jgi:hypothetical protein